jgi:hypothetical protein
MLSRVFDCYFVCPPVWTRVSEPKSSGSFASRWFLSACDRVLVHDGSQGCDLLDFAGEPDISARHTSWSAAFLDVQVYTLTLRLLAANARNGHTADVLRCPTATRRIYPSSAGMFIEIRMDPLDMDPCICQPTRVYSTLCLSSKATPQYLLITFHCSASSAICICGAFTSTVYFARLPRRWLGLVAQDLFPVYQACAGCPCMQTLLLLSYCKILDR